MGAALPASSTLTVSGCARSSGSRSGPSKGTGPVSAGANCRLSVSGRLHLESRDIESRPLWKPMHLQPVFRDCPARVCLPSGSGIMASDEAD